MDLSEKDTDWKIVETLSNYYLFDCKDNSLQKFT